jgi:hypothetical protein
MHEVGGGRRCEQDVQRPNLIIMYSTCHCHLLCASPSTVLKLRGVGLCCWTAPQGQQKRACGIPSHNVFCSPACTGTLQMNSGSHDNCILYSLLMACLPPLVQATGLKPAGVQVTSTWHIHMCHLLLFTCGPFRMLICSFARTPKLYSTNCGSHNRANFGNVSVISLISSMYSISLICRL